MHVDAPIVAHELGHPHDSVLLWVDEPEGDLPVSRVLRGSDTAPKDDADLRPYNSDNEMEYRLRKCISNAFRKYKRMPP